MRRVLTVNPHDASLNVCELDFVDAAEAKDWSKILKNREGWEFFAEWRSEQQCFIGARPKAAANAAKSKSYEGKSLAELKTEAGKRGVLYTEQSTVADLVATLNAKDHK